MKVKPLISVIVPVYNCEKYLEKCIRSIIKQTYSNIEIILIDDGSTDNSGKICDKYQSNKIVVIHQKNRGQAAARNAGIKLAKGEYIGFVDSDDWIDSKMYEVLLKNMETAGADISCCGIAKVDNKHFDLFNKEMIDYKEYLPVEALDILIDNKIITSSPCDKLYKSRILKNAFMREGVIFEDFDIMPKWLVEANKIVYTSKPLYYYRTTYNSTMSNHSIKRFDELAASRKRIEFYRKYAPESVYKAECKDIEIALNVLSYTRKTIGCHKKRKVIALDILKRLDRIKDKNWNNNVKAKILILHFGLGLFDLSNAFYDSLKNISTLRIKRDI